MPKFTIVALQGANGTKQSLKVPTAIQGAELKEEIWNVFGLSDDAADVEVRCITRGRPGTEIRIGPQDDLESLGITTGDILQVSSPDMEAGEAEDKKESADYGNSTVLVMGLVTAAGGRDKLLVPSEANGNDLEAAIFDQLGCGDAVHELEVRRIMKGKPGERLDVKADSTMESLGLQNGTVLHAVPVIQEREGQCVVDSCNKDGDQDLNGVCFDCYMNGAVGNATADDPRGSSTSSLEPSEEDEEMNSVQSSMMIVDDQMAALRNNLRSSFEEFHTKVAAARGKVRRSADSVLEYNKMMCEVEGGMERLGVVEAAARKEYDESKELLMDRRSQAGEIAVKCMEFGLKIAAQNLEVDKLTIDIDNVLSKHVVTPEKKLALSIKKKGKLIKSGYNGLDIYRPNFRKAHEDSKSHFRSFELGDATAAAGKNTKIIMVVGMTGAGKSLQINNLINFILGVNYDDDFRFKLILEEDEFEDRRKVLGSDSRSLAESMTRFVTSYTLHHQEGFRVPYSLVLIDTPGFADSSGIARDAGTIQTISKFFNDQTINIREISNICLIIQASTAKLTEEQVYVFSAVLDIFGNDVVENISILFTFADAQPPPAQEVVKKAEIPHAEGAVFKFNNSAVYAGRGDASVEFFWKFGFDSLEKYFLHLGKVTPASLDQTKTVLEKREQLQFYLDDLQKKIHDGMDKLKAIESISMDIMTVQGTLKANKDHKVARTVHPQSTKVVNHDITNCVACMFTCHSPCGIKGDLKQGCWAMSEGRCRICPGKCGYDSHRNGGSIYVYDEVVEEETIEDMADRYNVALGDKDAKIKLLYKLLEEYIDLKADVFGNIMQACETAKELEAIALGKSVLTSVDYIKRLIESERKSNRPNKDDRLEQLNFFLERAELLQAARTDSDNLTSNMSAYEATVMAAIEGLEKEMEEQDEQKRQLAEHRSKVKKSWKNKAKETIWRIWKP